MQHKLLGCQAIGAVTQEDRRRDSQFIIDWSRMGVHLESNMDKNQFMRTRFSSRIQQLSHVSQFPCMVRTGWDEVKARGMLRISLPDSEQAHKYGYVPRPTVQYVGESFLVWNCFPLFLTWAIIAGDTVYFHQKRNCVHHILHDVDGVRSTW